jgi:hypothetical protein
MHSHDIRAVAYVRAGAATARSRCLGLEHAATEKRISGTISREGFMSHFLSGKENHHYIAYP